MALLKESETLADYMIKELKWNQNDALGVGMICTDRGSPKEAEMMSEMLQYLKEHPNLDIDEAIDAACMIRQKRFGKQKFIIEK